MDLLGQRGCVMDWIDFVEDSVKAGWPLGRTLRRLSEAVGDVYGPEFRESWEVRMRASGYDLPGGAS